MLVRRNRSEQRRNLSGLCSTVTMKFRRWLARLLLSCGRRSQRWWRSLRWWCWWWRFRFHKRVKLMCRMLRGRSNSVEVKRHFIFPWFTNFYNCCWSSCWWERPWLSLLWCHDRAGVFKTVAINIDDMLMSGAKHMQSLCILCTGTVLCSTAVSINALHSLPIWCNGNVLYNTAL